jgi:hypothetical protein
MKMLLDMADALTTLARQDASTARASMVASAKEASDKVGSVLSLLNSQLSQHATTCMKDILRQWLLEGASIELDEAQQNTLTLIVNGAPWKVLHECLALPHFLEKAAAINAVVPTLNLEAVHSTLAAWAGFLVACASMCSDDAGVSLLSLDSFREGGATAVGAKMDELQTALAAYPEGEGEHFVNPAEAVTGFCDTWLRMASVALERPQALI